MESREIVAYGILVLIALFLAGVALWHRHNAHHRVLRRQTQRDDEAYERSVAERDER